MCRVAKINQRKDFYSKACLWVALNKKEHELIVDAIKNSNDEKVNVRELISKMKDSHNIKLANNIVAGYAYYIAEHYPELKERIKYNEWYLKSKPQKEKCAQKSETKSSLEERIDKLSNEVANLQKKVKFIEENYFYIHPDYVVKDGE